MTRAVTAVLLVALAACSDRLAFVPPDWAAELPVSAFPPTYVGRRSELQLTLINRSAARASLALDAAAPFNAPAQLTLTGGERREIDLVFAPEHTGTFTATIHVTGEGQAVDLDVTGTAIDSDACPAHDACSVETQAGGVCTVTPVSDGTECTAPCIDAGRCFAGTCRGAARSCDDRDACTRDLCSSATDTCQHVGVACAPSTDPCQAAWCDPQTGCATAPVSDGTACGPASCQTARVCIAGACVDRPVPEGAACGEPSPCQAAGRCVLGACVRPPAAPLLPSWSIAATGNASGVVDAASNLYLRDGSDLISLQGDGSPRWRVAASTGFDPLLVSQGLLVTGHLRAPRKAANGFEIRDAATGALRWAISPDALALAEHPGCTGLSPAQSRDHAPAADGAGRLYFEGGVFLDASCAQPTNDEQWLFAVDAATGGVAWKRSLVARGQAGNDVGLLLDEQARIHVAGPDLTRAFDAAGKVLWQAPAEPLAATFSNRLLDGSGRLWDASTGSAVTAALSGGSQGWVAMDAQRAWRFRTVAALPSGQLTTVDLSTGAATVHTVNLGPVLLPIVTGAFLTQQGTLAVVSSMNQPSGPKGYLANIHPDGTVAFQCELAGSDVLEGRPALKGGRLFTGHLAAYDVPGLDIASTGWVAEGGMVSRELRPR